MVKLAGTSQRVFYGHFESKEEAFLAALDSGSAQMLGTVLPAFRRAKSWEESVRGAYEAMFAFGIEEPEYTRLGAVEMYTVGRKALQTRDRVMEGLEVLLMPGYERAPDTAPIAAEAIGGAIYALIHDQVKRHGPETLARAGADGDLHDAGAVHRRRGGLRAGDRGAGEMVTAEHPAQAAIASAGSTSKTSRGGRDVRTSCPVRGRRRRCARADGVTDPLRCGYRPAGGCPGEGIPPAERQGERPLARGHALRDRGRLQPGRSDAELNGPTRARAWDSASRSRNTRSAPSSRPDLYPSRRRSSSARLSRRLPR